MKYMIIWLCIALVSCTQGNKPKEVQCRLIEYKPASLGCGVFSVWVGLKFLNMENCTEFVGYINCPEAYGDTFFTKGASFQILCSAGSPDSSKNVVINGYREQNLKEFIVDKITIKEIRLECR